ncbi:hypothetical protein WN944_026183 [Citrus x changshan-huyou]|uniref:Uncharacterized protein n=1 Tax=Citrus x changshan-huyou TaxID=2935761 RepID=A0AAP0QDP5_9ROSI
MCATVKLNGVKVRAMIDTDVMANLAVGLTLHHWVVLNSIAMANLSVGTWARETTFLVMAMLRFDVILGMEFLYNANVHVLPQCSCIWIGGMGKLCMVDCEYWSWSRLEPSLQTTNNGLDRGNLAMMSMIKSTIKLRRDLTGIQWRLGNSWLVRHLGFN